MAEHMSEPQLHLQPSRGAMSEETPSIVVIDDDASIRKSLDNLFRSVGFQAELFASPQEFLQSSRPDRPGCIVLDVRFPGRSGLDMQQELATANIQLPIIFITGYGDIPMSVRAMKAGAVEFLTKPFRDQDLLDAVGAALEKDRPPASRSWCGSPTSSASAARSQPDPRGRRPDCG
jgi:FixJ family two-component response regulator